MGEFFKTKRNLINLLTLAIMVAGLPIAFNLARNQAILFSQAAVDAVQFSGPNVTPRPNGKKAITQNRVVLQITSPHSPAPATAGAASIPVSAQSVSAPVTTGNTTQPPAAASSGNTAPAGTSFCGDPDEFGEGVNRFLCSAGTTNCKTGSCVIPYTSRNTCSTNSCKGVTGSKTSFLQDGLQSIGGLFDTNIIPLANAAFNCEAAGGRYAENITINGYYYCSQGDRTGNPPYCYLPNGTSCPPSNTTNGSAPSAPVSNVGSAPIPAGGNACAELADNEGKNYICTEATTTPSGYQWRSGVSCGGAGSYCYTSISASTTSTNNPQPAPQAPQAPAATGGTDSCSTTAKELDRAYRCIADTTTPSGFQWRGDLQCANGQYCYISSTANSGFSTVGTGGVAQVSTVEMSCTRDGRPGRCYQDVNGIGCATECDTGSVALSTGAATPPSETTVDCRPDNDGTQVKLWWKKVPGVNVYAIRVDNLKTPWSGDCNSPAGGDFCDDVDVNNGSGKYGPVVSEGDSYWYQVGLEKNVQYKWWVHSFKDGVIGNVSSTPQTYACPGGAGANPGAGGGGVVDASQLPSPSNLRKESCTDNNTQVILRWTPPSGDFDGYSVRIDNKLGKPPSGGSGKDAGGWSADCNNLNYGDVCRDVPKNEDGIKIGLETGVNYGAWVHTYKDTATGRVVGSGFTALDSYTCGGGNSVGTPGGGGGGVGNVTPESLPAPSSITRGECSANNTQVVLNWTAAQGDFDGYALRIDNTLGKPPTGGTGRDSGNWSGDCSNLNYGDVCQDIAKDRLQYQIGLESGVAYKAWVHTYKMVNGQKVVGSAVATLNSYSCGGATGGNPGTPGGGGGADTVTAKLNIGDSRDKTIPSVQSVNVKAFDTRPSSKVTVYWRKCEGATKSNCTRNFDFGNNTVFKNETANASGEVSKAWTPSGGNGLYLLVVNSEVDDDTKCTGGKIGGITGNEPVWRDCGSESQAYLTIGSGSSSGGGAGEVTASMKINSSTAATTPVAVAPNTAVTVNGSATANSKVTVYWRKCPTDATIANCTRDHNFGSNTIEGLRGQSLGSDNRYSASWTPPEGQGLYLLVVNAVIDTEKKCTGGKIGGFSPDESPNWKDCGSDSRAYINVTSSTPPPTTPPPGGGTVAFRIAENVNDLANAEVRPYNQVPMLIEYSFADPTPGSKFIWVQFIQANGSTENKGPFEIELLGPKMTLSNVKCTLSLKGDGVAVEFIGTNFGPFRQGNRVTSSSGTVDTPGASWTDTKIDSVLKTTPNESKTYNFTITRSDGDTATGSCGIGLTQFALGAKLFCRQTSTFEQSNVDLTVIPVAAGAGSSSQQAANPSQKQTEKVTIDKDGNIKNIKSKLEEGKQYKVTIKAPKSVRRTFTFTAQPGSTTVVNDFKLPVGDIWPLSTGDGKINSLDKSELNREWSPLQTANNKPGDFNIDSKVNSVDWSCMRQDFNAEDEPEI